MVLIIGLSIILIISSIVVLNYFPQEQTKPDKKSAFKYDKSSLENSEKVIRESFKYKNDHNLKKLRELYSSSFKNTNFRLDNLVSTKVLGIKLLNNETNYNVYFNSGRGRINDVERKNVIIYKVKYYVEYKDQTIEPENSGEYEKGFTLIKENNLGNWKIDTIGYPFFE